MLPRLIRFPAAVLLLVPVLLLSACTGSGDDTKPAGAVTASVAGSQGTATELVLLKTSPERGPGGTNFTVTGEGLQPSTSIEFVWLTAGGSYKTELINNEVQYVDREWADQSIPLGPVTSDAQGKLSADFTAPDDFFGAHDIYALVDGKQAAKAGFWIERTFEISPHQGPVGTPIKVRVTGLGNRAYTSTGAIRYDNNYMGFVSATTTRGTAEFEIRAAGPVGDHVVMFDGASHAVPYLNIEQSPVAYIGSFRVPFRVTADNGAPANALEWPDAARVNTDPALARTTLGVAPVAADDAVQAVLSPGTGPINSTHTLEVSGLPAGTKVDLKWVNVSGNRVIGGWDLTEEELGKATASAAGTVSTRITAPDTLGGWHAIRLVSGDKLLAEVPYFVERSIASVTPQRVKAGETFTVTVKGIGWTQLDNGVAIMYDNSYIGMACGFASNGDVTLLMTATGEPGTHLIDLYPMIYDGGQGKYPWQYNLPMLTFATDHPSLGLGYRIPAMHLAIEVVP